MRFGTSLRAAADAGTGKGVGTSIDGNRNMQCCIGMRMSIYMRKGFSEGAYDGAVASSGASLELLYIQVRFRVFI